MDDTHIRSLNRWPGSDPERVRLFLGSWLTGTDEEVPDPYYGNMADFEEVYEMVLRGCKRLLSKLGEETPV
jgi:protein-tyrosine phosphatase